MSGCEPAFAQKNSYANGSEKGAPTQAPLMTILLTIKMRGHNPVQVLVEVLLAISTTAAFADKNHGRRLKSYKIFSPTI